MSQKHHLQAKLPKQYGKSEAIWACNPSGHALIFVHGFWGHPIKTWIDFHGLMPQQAEATGCDLVFYDYDGTHQRTHKSACGLRDFLGTLSTQPLTVINSSLPNARPRNDSFRFTRFTLVAHSTGAVVSRDALLQGYKSRSPWAPLTELVLFAPAHMGVSLQHLVQEAAPRRLKQLYRALQAFGFYQTLLDVEPGCQTLRYLFTETQRMLKGNAAPTLAAKKVILAENDTVIDPTPFCGDPPAEWIPGKKHKTVCKPRPDFPEPVDKVRSIC